MALRATSPEALERQVAAIEAAGLGIGWHDGDHGHGRAYRFHDPDGHVMEVLWESDRYAPPEHLQARRCATSPSATRRAARRSSASTTSTCSPPTSRPAARFATDTLGYRHYEGIRLDSGEETGAWLSLTIAAHELIYVKDARGAGGRLHHLAFWVDTREECLRAADIFLDAGVHIEAAPSRHAVAAGFFLYSFEPGGNRIEVTTGGYLVYEPDPEPVIWTEAERARGQAWGVKTVESFHYYGTPPTAEDRAYALAAGVAAPLEPPRRSSSERARISRKRSAPSRSMKHRGCAIGTSPPRQSSPNGCSWARRAQHDGRAREVERLDAQRAAFRISGHLGADHASLGGSSARSARLIVRTSALMPKRSQISRSAGPGATIPSHGQRRRH